MTRKIAILIAVSFFSLAALVLLRYVSEDYLSDHIIDNNRFEEIKKTRALADDMSLKVYFDEQELFYDKAAGAFFYSLIDDKETAYDPSVDVTGDANLQFAFLNSGITDDAIANNTPLTCIFYNDDNYCIRNIICSFLPLMNIECDGEITEIETGMNMRLYDNRKQCATRDMSSEGFIRIRGGNTRSFPKKPLKIALVHSKESDNPQSNNMSLLGMRKDDDYILYPAYNDAEKVRNVFSQNLWYNSCNKNNRYGVTTGVEYRFLELFINGEYSGLYALGYTPDEKMIGISKNEEYVGFYKRLVGVESSEVAYNEYGGLLGWRVVNLPAGEDEESYSGNRWDPLMDYLENLQNNSSDVNALKKCIDIDNAIDYTLFINLVQGDDNLFKNYYLFVREIPGGFYSYYCPWDLDVAWGNMFVPNVKNGYLQYGHKPYYNLLFEDLYFGQIMAGDCADIVEKSCDRFAQLRKGAWSDDTIRKMLDEYEKDVCSSGAYLRDKERWSDGSYRAEGEPNNFDKFRAYVAERLSEADGYYARLKNLAKEDIFIRRAAQYKNFDSSSFVIEINDSELLNDSAYAALLDRIGGIDVGKIGKDVRYVIKVPGEEVIYLKDFAEDASPLEKAVEIKAGKHKLVLKPGAERDYLDEETGYTVYLDGVACYDAYTDSREPFIVSLSYEGFGEKMNLKRDYRINFN